MKCYPVLIPTLNRYDHLKDCITSLSECKLADETDLIIGLDYPPSPIYEDGYRKIKNYLRTISGFRSVIIFERDHNFGAENNLINLIDYARENYDAYIVSEDDNIFAPTFLEFMNSALDRWRNDLKISTICGYTLENQYQSDPDFLLTPDCSAWGIGCWIEKNYELNGKFVNDVLFSIKKSWRVFRVYPLCLGMLMNMFEMKQWYGDTVRTAYNILNKFYQIRPSSSLVRNMGHDGSGLHCSDNDYGFENQILCSRYEYHIEENSKGKVLSWHYLFFQGLHRSKIHAIFSIIKIWIRYIVFRVKENHYYNS